MSKDRSYYGANRGGSNGGDIRAEDMVIEAVELAAKQGVDFSKFTNAEGKVENVIVIYAGQGEASGGSPETIWPHEYDLRRLSMESSSIPISLVTSLIHRTVRMVSVPSSTSSATLWVSLTSM